MTDFMRDEPSAPAVVDRGTFQAELDALRVREKAHTREGDAIAAARRRLPMVEVDGATPLIGERGAVTLFDVFERRRMLIAYYFMWHTSHRAFVGVSALLFATSAALTIVWCAYMSAMRGMPMAGGWTMSMVWMRMPGQTWLGAAASFLGMWLVMMVAMMLASLVQMLWHYRQAVDRTDETRLGPLTALVGVGYFLVWTLFGMAVFPLGVGLAAVEMQDPALARAVPIAVGVVVVIAGILQFAAWKARHLAWCREARGRGRTLPADVATAWRHGVRLGLHCTYCCANLMAILLVIGVMDIRAMAVVTAAITVERLAPAGERIARAIGAVVVAAGLFLIARAAGLG